MFDLVWHEIFGIEVDIEALLSPSHIVLLLGGLLIVSTPVRGAWSDPASRAPSLGQLSPALVSVVLTTLLVAFFFMYASPFLSGAATQGPYDFIAFSVPDSDIAAWMTEEVQI